MKPHYLVAIIVALPLLLLAQTVKKPTRPPTSKPATKPAAPTQANPRSKIEAAVRSKVEAYYKGRVMGSAGVKVVSVSVKITQTEPVPGWTGRWRCSGTAALRLGGGIIAEGDRGQTRSFDATATVSDSGVIESVDVSGS